MRRGISQISFIMYESASSRISASSVSKKASGTGLPRASKRGNRIDFEKRAKTKADSKFFREEFQERLEEHREGRRAFRTELKQKGEALWQKLDRYL